MSEELTPMDRMELWMSAINEAIANGTENTYTPYDRHELWMKKICESILAKDPADPDVVEAFVNDWLDDHPEATTTVEDGAVTTAKLASNAVTTAKIADGAVTDLKLASKTVQKNSDIQDYQLKAAQYSSLTVNIGYTTSSANNGALTPNTKRAATEKLSVSAIHVFGIIGSTYQFKIAAYDANDDYLGGFPSRRSTDADYWW